MVVGDVVVDIDKFCAEFEDAELNVGALEPR